VVLQWCYRYKLGETRVLEDVARVSLRCYSVCLDDLGESPALLLHDLFQLRKLELILRRLRLALVVLVGVGLRQGCYRGVTGLLQDCYRGVIEVLQGCNRGVTGLSQGCMTKDVPAALQGCSVYLQALLEVPDDRLEHMLLASDVPTHLDLPAAVAGEDL
jgi:hypothetical protein